MRDTVFLIVPWILIQTSKKKRDRRKIYVAIYWGVI